MKFEPGANHHILLVVNDIKTMSQLFSILNTEQYIVSREVTIQNAKQNILENNSDYDIILIGYELPDGNGEQFLKWIKHNTVDVPVIILGTDNANSVVVKCFKAGAQDFIAMPIDTPTFLSVIQMNLKESKSQKTSNSINAEIFTHDWIELSANSEIEYLSRIQKLCTRLLSNKLDSSIVEDIRFAMEEYGRNAIEWGNKFDKSKLFKISYCLFKDRVILKFEDEGEGFDLKSIPDPSKDPVEHLKLREEMGKRPGGYGIFMMKTVMDETIYNDKGNVCVMTKYIAN